MREWKEMCQNTICHQLHHHALLAVLSPVPTIDAMLVADSGSTGKITHTHQMITILIFHKQGAKEEECKDVQDDDEILTRKRSIKFHFKSNKMSLVDVPRGKTGREKMTLVK